MKYKPYRELTQEEQGRVDSGEIPLSLDPKLFIESLTRAQIFTLVLLLPQIPRAIAEALYPEYLLLLEGLAEWRLAHYPGTTTETLKPSPQYNEDTEETFKQFFIAEIP